MTVPFILILAVYIPEIQIHDTMGRLTIEMGERIIQRNTTVAS